MKSASLFILFQFVLFVGLKASAQDYLIKGEVKSASEPLVGAHVKWNNEIHVTDLDGKFEIHSKVDKGEIVVSFVGYEHWQRNLELSAKSESNLKIVLKSNRVWNTDDVVVTATRTKRDVELVSQPVSVVSNKEIKQSGSLRLNDILIEQIGMTLVNDHGTGIQLQGMDADYALILIDGQPIIGRTSGTLDLKRIAVSNVKQIEIVKGPSSAIWGSEALSGVINIITEKPQSGVSTNISSRYGSFNSLDLGVESSFSSSDYSQTIFANRNASLGYSLNSNSISKTVPEFYNYTVSYRGMAKVGANTEFEVRSRFYNENQKNVGIITENNVESVLEEKAEQYDFSLIPILRYQLSGTQRIEFIHNSSWFSTETNNNFKDGDALYSESSYEQRMHKTEFQWDAIWNNSHHTTSGAGYTYETVNADRYIENPFFKSVFSYSQHEWEVNPKLNVTGGVRLDYHSEYSGEISPKIGFRYEAYKNLHIKFSAGKGFKAPEFRQLFLDFTNPTSGYSVFGTSTVLQRLAEMQNNGEISTILINPSALTDIQAEKSFALNFGIDYTLKKDLRFKLNVYRNNIKNLIDSQPIAIKTNGQSVYTYFNLDRIYTQGAEIEVYWDLFENFSVMGGYAFLEAKDESVIDKIEEGIVYRRNPQTNMDERVKASDYGGLFNRSKNSGSLRLFYSNPATHWDASLRVVFRGTYGFIDKNNNQILDQGNEYEKGYSLTNLNVAKTFANRFRTQFGIDNVFNFTRPNQLGFLPGRTYYAQLQINF